jgi:hypothetical protein
LPGTAAVTSELLTRQEPSGCSRAADHLLRTGITPIAILGRKVIDQFEVGEGRFHPGVSRSLWPLATGLGERLDQSSDQRVLAARRGRGGRELRLHLGRGGGASASCGSLSFLRRLTALPVRRGF